MTAELQKSTQVQLDVPSEGLLVWEHAGFTQTEYGAYSFVGKCDPEAMKQAVLDAQAARPNFHSNRA